MFFEKDKSVEPGFDKQGKSGGLVMPKRISLSCALCLDDQDKFWDIEVNEKHIIQAEKLLREKTLDSQLPVDQQLVAIAAKLIAGFCGSTSAAAGPLFRQHYYPRAFKPDGSLSARWVHIQSLHMAGRGSEVMGAMLRENAKQAAPGGDGRSAEVKKKRKRVEG